MSSSTLADIGTQGIQFTWDSIRALLFTANGMGFYVNLLIVMGVIALITAAAAMFLPYKRKNL